MQHKIKFVCNKLCDKKYDHSLLNSPRIHYLRTTRIFKILSKLYDYIKVVVLHFDSKDAFVNNESHQK